MLNLFSEGWVKLQALKMALPEMVDSKGLRFPIDVILVCIRWCAAYSLSYRHLEKMREERGVLMDHSSINRWAIRFLPLLTQDHWCLQRIPGVVSHSYQKCNIYLTALFDGFFRSIKF